ncbi:ParA family protein [Rhodococcus sp. IEGM 1401]|uniref:ParA family protein n=1 Tax=unclassified Rhodococcus (in: high G+C Gram-positive bacteria) TaxID=192944 RepID=UPI0022B4D0F0|nr:MULTISPECIES: ParA family protein [unclassified Rhodococcus (in: high G+C Gram-positive bacteria)]MCX6489383.1 ParA family protein [Rhodococcus sp. (in: high G+C Gram-positive bacteria)]MCZ4562205.1 ParA family protein [Rhodococcus sp. IEGM 1401]MDI9922248.1 ParA family protein [Rhodococcus sp. IEGM 1372]MDV8035269.1 ParA family protein [Rhodococcus sp. IEGM 1414]
MTITAIANLKGGVGKTTIVNGLAHAAASARRTCLVVDADSQGNSTKHLTSHDVESPPDWSLADVLDRDVECSAEQAIIKARRSGIDVLPSGFGDLQAVMDTLVAKTGGEMAVDRALKAVADKYEHILIDCRPAIDLVSRGALYAADNVLIVVNPESDAIDGFDAIRQSIDDLEQYMGKVLPIAGVVVNKIDGRRADHAKTLEYLRGYVKEADIPIVGEPIPMLTDISKLTNVGMGLDEHPRPTGRIRNLHENFVKILNATGGEAK